MKWPAQMLTVALIWGASFMFIKVELDDGIAPAARRLAAVRRSAASRCCAILKARGERFPRDRELLRHLVVVAALMNAIPFVFFAYGETEVSSLLAGLLNATTPLLTLLFSLVIVPGERPTRMRIVGILVGFSGVLVVLGPWEGLGRGSLLGALACLGAASCYGLGLPLHAPLPQRPVRRPPSRSPPRRSASASSCSRRSSSSTRSRRRCPASTPGAPSSPSARWAPASPTSSTSTSSAIAGHQTASTVTYIVPIFAVIFGVSLLGEPLSWHEPAGGALILLGVTLANRRSPATLPAPAPPSAAPAEGCRSG